MNENILCDGCVFSPAIYLAARGEDLGSRDLIEQYLTWFETYDLFLLTTPRGVPFVRDSVRIETAAMRMAMHRAFVDFLYANKAKLIELNGSVDERLKTVLSELVKS